MLSSRRSLTILVLVAVVFVLAGAGFFGWQVYQQHEQTQERVGQLEVELAEAVRIQEAVREAKERAQRRADLANEKLQHERTRADTAEAKVQDLLDGPTAPPPTANAGKGQAGGTPPEQPAEPVFDTEKHLRSELDKAREEINRLTRSEKQAKEQADLAKKAEKRALRQAELALAGEGGPLPPPPGFGPGDMPVPPEGFGRNPGDAEFELIRELQRDRQRALEQLQKLRRILPGRNLPVPPPIPGLQ